MTDDQDANPRPDETPETNDAGASASPPSDDEASRLAEQALAAAREAISSIGGEGSEPTSESPTAAAPGETPSDADAEAMAEAMLAGMGGGPETPAGATAFEPPTLSGGVLGDQSQVIELLDDVNLNVTIELGRTRMLIEDVLRLNDGAVVELDKLAGDPVDVYVNDRHIARGEVLVLNENFCVRISEIIDQEAQRATG
ncbi:MAG: flagellar motor switch protein FliN [Planctomycetota bacterium]